MKYKQFIEEMRQKIADCFDDETSVESVKAQRNNNTCLYGITVKRKECNWAPTIYLEKFYFDYLQGTDMETLLQEFLDLYKEKQNVDIPKMDFFREYKKVKERFSVKLIHYGKNKEFLKRVPHKRVWNLAMIVYCNMTEITYAHATITVTYEHIRKWKVSEDQLFHDAFRNAQVTMPCHVRPMSQMLKELMQSDVAEGIYDEEMLQEMEKQSESMLILTNQQNFFGAACILYEDVLQAIADENKTDYYILPSSVHEMILVPLWMAGPPTDLKRMVQEINRTQVEAEDVLCDDVYFFDRMSGKIMQV